MSISFYQLTFAQAYSNYLTGDLTAKGLIHVYFKIYRVKIQDIWENPLAKEELRKKLNLEKSTFYTALNKLYVEAATRDVA